MASINGEAPAAAGNINPLLLASALVGSWEALDVLFKREDAQEPPMVIPTQDFLALLTSARGRIAAPDTRDVELGGYPQPASFAAGELLKGITYGGDTALHAVAGNGDRQDFLKCAGMICGRERGLLFAKNHNGDTPLHCAARAGNSKMVSLLIGLAGREGPHGKLTLLRMENKLRETALHEAVRNGEGRILGPKDREALFDAQGTPAEERIRAFVEQEEERTIVKLLMGADPELANYPVDGISPLYLAILLEKSTIALILYDRSGGNLSYSGRDGQNALHVAVLPDRDTVMMELLLDWNKSLITQVDIHGSTPLHFASAEFFSTDSYLHHEPLRRFPWRRFVRFHPKQALHELFKANPAALYQGDKNGFFPIHVAASVGTMNVIQFFLHERPDSGGLRDSKGKTLLHVAIENGRVFTVMDVCAKPSLAWILNMQDNDGNTALHLAIQAGSLDMATTLIGNPKVNLNLTNNQGETPHDISIIKLLRGMTPAKNSESRINYVLRCVGAKHGAFRWDKNAEHYNRRSKPAEGQDKQSDKLKDATQSYMVASVLISSMAFSATFAIPGGYIADDRANGGTPTLAGSYIFDAYIMASTLAFICSLLSTTGFMLAGNTMVSLATRKFYIDKSAFFISGSVTSLCIAFALGVYMALAPVALRTAIAVCFIIPFLLFGRNMGFNSQSILLARPILIRKGLFPGMVLLLSLSGAAMVTALWPFVVTFGWAALARIHLTVEQFDHLIMVSFWPTVVICGSYTFRIMYNVLHYCIKVIIEFLLHCNKNLTTQVDKDGSTPLHFIRFSSTSTWTIERVFKTNPAALYQADKNGFSPIHVAASVGAIGIIRFFIRHHPDSAGLCDARGKTFLHVAIEKRRLSIVLYACQNPSLTWILNMQDNDGNTALHLAIHGGGFNMSCALLGNPKVNLNLTNNLGETPLDVSRKKVSHGVHYGTNFKFEIWSALYLVGANNGALRWDGNGETHSRLPKSEAEDRESEGLKDTSQNFIVASVLIATMAFTAIFAFPGGFRSADDHTNGGTPTVAGGYIFYAFINAATIAFLCSLVATTGFMLAGSPIAELAARRIYLRRSERLFFNSVTCMSIVFPLGAFLVLAPVAGATSVMIFVFTFSVLLSENMVWLRKFVLLARPLLVRRGKFLGTVQLLVCCVYQMAITLWPLVAIFGWAGIQMIRDLQRYPFPKFSHPGAAASPMDIV